MLTDIPLFFPQATTIASIANEGTHQPLPASRRSSMIRYPMSVALAAAIISVSSISLAQSSQGKESGLALGLRLGYALPMGKVGAVATVGGTANTTNDNLSDGFTGMVPIWLDVG